MEVYFRSFEVPFGMWLVALLVNSNTLDEMAIVWRNICIVLISPSQNDQFKMSLSLLSKMAEEMNANPDKTNFVLKDVVVTPKGQVNSNLPTDVSNNPMKAKRNTRLFNRCQFRILLLYIYTFLK
jgi:hypothetical protein